MKVKKTSSFGLRMGIHTGPVYRIADINANFDVAGGGINLAQRVMDCGDAGHVLLSETVASMLQQLSTWNHSIQDLGQVEGKHGILIHIFNLFNDEFGNPHKPTRLCPKPSVPAKQPNLFDPWTPVIPPILCWKVGIACEAC